MLDISVDGYKEYGGCVVDVWWMFHSGCWISRWMGASGKSNLVWLPPALICPLGKPEINLDEARNDSFFHPATPAMFIAIAATIMIMVALMVATQYGN